MRGTLTAVKEYLRHNRIFRSLFGYPLAWKRHFSMKEDRIRADRYQRTVVGGDIVLQPANMIGQFTMPASSHIAQRIVLDGDYEPRLAELISKMNWLEGDVINVGANVGLYSVFFTEVCPAIEQVWAIEPNPQALHFLRKNIIANRKDAKITVIEALVSRETGEVPFETVEGKPEYSSIGGIIHPSAVALHRSSTRILALPLNELLPETCRPSLIFVDTEGAELLVFQGAEEIIRRHGPIIVFECEEPLLAKFGHDSRMVERYLDGLGYTVRNAFCIDQRLQHPFLGEAIAFPASRIQFILSKLR